MRAANATRVGLVLAVAASLTTCRLDKLIKPSIADRLTVSADSVIASANVGSLVAREDTLLIGTADGVTLRWTASKTAAWVTLDPDSGQAPATLVVRLHPDTLSQTPHRDTIVFTSSHSGDTVRVPVFFDMLPAAADLSLSVTAHADTAFARSAQSDTFSLRIKNTGALPLNWTATIDTGWVTLSDSGGTVPPQDTTSTVVLVTLRPGSLGAATHVGRIVFDAPGAEGAPDTVRVSYAIQPCVEAGVIPDAAINDVVTLSDCGAPRKAGSQAKVYAVQSPLGDTLSLRLAAAFDAFLVLTNAAGDSLAANDECGVEVGTACLKNYGVPSAGRYLIEVTTAVGGATGPFTLSVVSERPPSTPQAIGQFRGDSTTAIGIAATTTQNVVVFKGTLNDPNPSDSLRLEIELTGSASGMQVDSSAVVPSGGTAFVRVPGLVENEGYHWRARTCDKTGRCSAWLSFGGNPETGSDFFVNAVSEDPALSAAPDQFGSGGGAMPVGGGTGGTLGGNVTVTFKGVVSDPDPRDLIAIEVEVKETNAAFDGNPPIVSRGSGVAASATASVAISLPVPLLFTANYHWRARACDQTNRCGAWVPFGGNSDVVTADPDFHVP